MITKTKEKNRLKELGKILKILKNKTKKSLNHKKMMMKVVMKIFMKDMKKKWEVLKVNLKEKNKF